MGRVVAGLVAMVSGTAVPATNIKRMNEAAAASEERGRHKGRQTDCGFPDSIFCRFLDYTLPIMNHTVFTLEEFEVERLKALEALQCLVHTIILTRSLGECTPRHTECNTFPMILLGE